MLIYAGLWYSAHDRRYACAVSTITFFASDRIGSCQRSSSLVVGGTWPTGTNTDRWDGSWSVRLASAGGGPI
jgi:hypothetical protein